MYPGNYSKLTPDKIAVVNSATGHSMSYKELDDRSNQLAQLFWAEGLRRGDHVSIFMENDIRYFQVIWAAMRSGLYLTTINRYLTTDEAAYIINDSASQVVVSSTEMSSQCEGLLEQCSKVQRWLMLDEALAGFEVYDSALDAYPAECLAEEPAGGFMLYSSGTTGQPKGVLRPLPNARINESAAGLGGLQKALWMVDENTVCLSTAPLYHAAPVSFGAAVQALGGTLVMMPKFSGSLALEAMEKYHVTHSQWVPTMFSRMLKMDAEERLKYDLSSHRVAVHAAAPCPRGVKQDMFDWWGPIIYEYYGGTELNGLTHVSPNEWLEKPGTVGKPVLGIIHICDDEGNEVKANEVGMVYFELPKMPFKYLNEESKTKDAQHPDHANWSALGDVGYVDEDGYLFLSDRASFMIISGGVNIYPQEVEDVMIMHPQVADVAAFGIPNEDMGEEVKAAVQLVEGVDKSDALALELIAYCKQKLANYKCPKSIDFETELPRLPTGKLYKKLLKDRYWGDKKSRIV
ncbi:MAG: AMP-binding protein [Pseudomonadales bacterium]|nr:AMP-binding protein [Pseudomonadales bacterium]